MSGGEEFLERIAAELRRAGVRGRAGRRIVTEFADHLDCDPQAELGDPRLIARQFADELGTSRARTAATRSFWALAVAGGAVLARVLTLMPLRQLSGRGVETAALLVCALAAQIALVAGSLGAARALRVRWRATISTAEAAVLARRAGLGLLAGAVAILALPFAASASPHAHSDSWPQLAASGVALLALALASPTVIQAVRTRPAVEGTAGDLFCDFGPLECFVRRFAGSPRRLALVSALGLFVVLSLAGAGAGDGYDGLVRGALEAGAFLACYRLLGGYLGIRPD